MHSLGTSGSIPGESIERFPKKILVQMCEKILELSVYLPKKFSKNCHRNSCGFLELLEVFLDGFLEMSWKKNRCEFLDECPGNYRLDLPENSGSRKEKSWKSFW